MIYIPPIAFLAYLVRSLAFGCGLGDAVTLTALAALYALQLYMQSKTLAPINESFREEIDQIKSAINALKIGSTFKR